MKILPNKENLMQRKISVRYEGTTDCENENNCCRLGFTRYTYKKSGRTLIIFLLCCVTNKMHVIVMKFKASIQQQHLTKKKNKRNSIIKKLQRRFVHLDFIELSLSFSLSSHWIPGWLR